MVEALKPIQSAKGKRIPKTRYPITTERWYAVQIRKLVSEWSRIAKWYVNHDLRPYVAGGVTVLDANNDPTWIDKVRHSISLMGFTIDHAENDNALMKLATRFVRSLDNFSFSNVHAQTAIVGLNPIGNDPNLSTFIKGKIAENVALIKSMRTTYWTQLENDLYRSVTGGNASLSSITSSIAHRNHISNNHASMIARDQTGTIISNTDAYRNQQAGVESYIWRTANDDRVRLSHQELEGKEFRYDDPDGGDEGLLPGEPINCRCYAEPVYDL